MKKRANKRKIGREESESSEQPAIEHTEREASPDDSSADEDVVASGAKGAAIGGLLGGSLGATLGGAFGLTTNRKAKKKNRWY